MRFNFIRKFFVLAILSSAIILQSCSDDKNDPVIKLGESGFFVVNEGDFASDNTSISFYDRKTETMSNDIYIAKNGEKLGKQAQSMSVFEGKGYIIVQGSKKIEVIDPADFSKQVTITEGITSPRYFLGVSPTKAYVSDWGADGVTGTVKVLDLTTNTVTKTIPTGQGANRMLKIGNLVYVTNNGGYGNDNTIKIIDTATDAVTGTITTNDNPNSIQQDKDGNLWVACSGITVYDEYPHVDEENSTKGSISKFKPDHTEEFRLSVSDFVYGGVGDLNISPDGTTLYYLYSSQVYSLKSTDTTLPAEPIADKFFYGLSVDPFNGDIIGCEAPNFSSAGSIHIYSATGTLKKSHTVGIGPNGCAFK